MKKLRILTLILAVALIFGGCGASSLSLDSKNEAFDAGGWTEEMKPVEPEAPMEMPEMEYVTEDSAFDNSTSASVSENKPLSGRKLIRTFNLDVETLEFDSFVASLKNEVSALGGYIENSSVNGNSYNYSSNRNAGFTCRIPSEKLDEFINTIGGLGNITYSYEDTTDVTLQYVDTEARIKSLQTEYDRLLELLAEAETIDTIILLEQRITEVRYQLESYQSQLRTYDNLVDYSTVHLNVNEVKRVTATEKETVWERISADFGDNIYDIWVGAQDFFVWFVANIPYFIIWAIIIAAVVFAVRFFLGKNPKWQERKAARKARKEYKKAQKLSEKAWDEHRNGSARTALHLVCRTGTNTKGRGHLRCSPQ
ncbi:MAG: DUF4349 domain-containing protein [Oscillospiraceae bacterium]|nr:DUF4349 domain-containing protein [Oscillospiraceae bacterium]